MLCKRVKIPFHREFEGFEEKSAVARFEFWMYGAGCMGNHAYVQGDGLVSCCSFPFDEMYGLSKEVFFEDHIEKSGKGCRKREEITAGLKFQGVTRESNP